MIAVSSYLFVLAPWALRSLAHPVQAHSDIKWVDCHDQIPHSLDTTDLDLEDLPSTLHCGRISVPMNYAKPMAADNNITLGLAMYRPKKPEGVIFFNPGGSDEATVYAWQAALNQSNLFSELMDFDLMMLDVRGTFSSTPLNVSLDAFEGILGAYPTTREEFEDFKAGSAKVISSWSDLSSPQDILQFVGTREVVQDYDVVRKALGYNEIHFLGASYGSFRAAQYASTFPEHVGRFVLDAVTPHGRDIFDEAQDQIAAANRGLQRADAFCLDNTACPFNVQGKGGVLKAYSDVLTAAEAAPIPAPMCMNSTQCISPVTRSHIQQATLNMLLGQPSFPTIIQALKFALAGDASDFAVFAGDPLPSIEPIWPMPILCNDYNLGNNSFEAFNASFNAARKADKKMIGRSQAWQIQLFCSAWPFPTPALEPLPQNDAATLFVTADFDVNTPTEWSRAAWASSSNAALVVRHGDDHVSFLLPDQPSTLITKEFLQTGKLPEPREEDLVSVYRPGMELSPIADPYTVPVGQEERDLDVGA